MRIRTDWLITNPIGLVSLVRQFHDSNKEIGALQINSPVSAILPLPYFQNDVLMIGSPSSLSDYWDGNLECLEDLLGDNCNFFSAHFFGKLEPQRSL